MKGKGRWERAADSIMSMADELVRVELRSNSGEVLRVVEIDQADDDDDDGAADELAQPRRASTALDPKDARELHLVRLVLDAQDRALERQQVSMRETQELTLSTMRVMADRLAGLEKMYGQVLKASFDATIARAEAHSASQAADADGMVDQLAAQVIGQMTGGGGMSGMVPNAPMPPMPTKKH